MRSLLLPFLVVSLCQAFLPPLPHSSSRPLSTRSPQAATSVRPFALAALKNAASDDNEDASAAPSTASTIKKRKRKVPLPAELLQEQADSAAAPSPLSSSSSSTSSSSPPPPSPVPEQTGGGEVDLQERLQQDIARFRKKEVEAKVDEEELTGFSAFADKAGGVLNKVLVADFFVILAFFGWFVTGVFFKSVLSDASVIDKFTDIWMPVIQPALGLLMAGTLGVGALNNVAARTQEANERKGMEERKKNM